MRAIILVSHGSRFAGACREIQQLARRLKRKSAIPIFECAFLEMNRPTIPQAIQTCARKGAKEIMILLNFLNLGSHVEKDIPRLIHAAQKKYPKINFNSAPHLGMHPKLDTIFLDMI